MASKQTKKYSLLEYQRIQIQRQLLEVDTEINNIQKDLVRLQEVQLTADLEICKLNLLNNRNDFEIYSLMLKQKLTNLDLDKDDKQQLDTPTRPVRLVVNIDEMLDVRGRSESRSTRDIVERRDRSRSNLRNRLSGYADETNETVKSVVDPNKELEQIKVLPDCNQTTELNVELDPFAQVEPTETLNLLDQIDNHLFDEIKERDMVSVFIELRKSLRLSNLKQIHRFLLHPSSSLDALLAKVFDVANDVFDCSTCNRNVLIERDGYATVSVHKLGTYFDIVVFTRDGRLTNDGQRVAVVVEKMSVYMFVLIGQSIGDLNDKLNELFEHISSTIRYRDVRQIRFAASTLIDLSEFSANHPSTRIVHQLPILDLNNHRYSLIEYLDRLVSLVANWNSRQSWMDRFVYSITVHNLTVQLCGNTAFMIFYGMVDKRIVLDYGQSVLVNVYKENAKNPEIREALFVGHDSTAYRYIVRVDDGLWLVNEIQTFKRDDSDWWI